MERIETSIKSIFVTKLTDNTIYILLLCTKINVNVSV